MAAVGSATKGAQYQDSDDGPCDQGFSAVVVLVGLDCNDGTFPPENGTVTRVMRTEERDVGDGR